MRFELNYRDRIRNLGGYQPDTSKVIAKSMALQKIQPQQAHLKCKGVSVCQFIDPALFSGCKRYEPDEGEMRTLWNHELEANEREANSVDAFCPFLILLTFGLQLLLLCPWCEVLRSMWGKGHRKATSRCK